MKGAPSRALAEKFIVFVSWPRTQKVFSEQVPCRPIHKSTLVLLPKTVQGALPIVPVNLKGVQAVGAEFRMDHGKGLEQRFNTWAAR